MSNFFQDFTLIIHIQPLSLLNPMFSIMYVPYLQKKNSHLYLPQQFQLPYPSLLIFIYYYLRQNMQEPLKTRPPSHCLHPSPVTRILHLTPQSTRTQNIKTVEIFINNLDRQITDSYRKLKKNREKLSAKKQQSTFIEESLPHANSSTFQRGEQESNYYVAINSSPPKHSIPSQQQIILLDNKDVMEYIYLVYDRYNIKDPLGGEEGEGGEGEETDKYMTNKKIRKFKDRLQREIGSASTMKNSELYKSVQLNSFPEMKKTILKRQYVSGAKIEVVSLISKHQSRNSSKQRHEQPQSLCNTLTSFRLKNENVISKKQKINITAFKSVEVMRIPSAVASVSQLFRFCFMCEQPILQCNLFLHEKTCEPLKQALQYNFDGILQILDEKIQRLIDEINHQLIEKTEQRIKEQFKNIKDSVKNWLNQLPIDPLNNSSQKKNRSQKWRGEFNKVQQDITNSFCSSFHLIHKLQWFSKLRQNIMTKFALK